MNKTRRLLNGLIACGVALGMVSALVAQPADQAGAKVVRLKGGARYKIGSGDWQPLKLGDVVHSGTVIQTAAKSRVDLVLGDASAPVARAVPSDVISYQPTAEQNIVRLWENTLLGVDKMTETHTGADVVTETQLDLKAGHITGSVKKMSAASKYEVKIPNGVAGIRGTVYDISAEGVIKVLSGSVVLAYVGPSGSVVTQVIMGLQMFDARTGVLSPLPNTDKTGMSNLVKQMTTGFIVAPTPVSANSSLQYISPH
jgi:hypothetical protein